MYERYAYLTSITMLAYNYFQGLTIFIIKQIVYFSDVQNDL